jgi:hypothetical protein
MLQTPVSTILLIAAFAFGSAPSVLITVAVLILLPVLAAWLEFLGFGLPHIPAVP